MWKLMSISKKTAELHTTCNKGEFIKEFIFLHDIFSKGVESKTGGHDEYTTLRWKLMTCVMKGLKVNWFQFLFNITVEEAVKPTNRRGYGLVLNALLRATKLTEARHNFVSKKREVEKEISLDKAAEKGKKQKTPKKSEKVATKEVAAVVEEEEEEVEAEKLMARKRKIPASKKRPSLRHLNDESIDEEETETEDMENVVLSKRRKLVKKGTMQRLARRLVVGEEEDSPLDLTGLSPL